MPTTRPPARYAYCRFPRTFRKRCFAGFGALAGSFNEIRIPSFRMVILFETDHAMGNVLPGDPHNMPGCFVVALAT
jgi:hypothetical protein